MNEQEFAQRLRQYRRDKGLTQQELADRLGVSNKTVSRWEGGSYPDVTTLVALARALGVTVDELLDPKAPVRTLAKSDWQNLLSFAFAIGGGLLFYLLAQFVPVPLCWMLYLGCLAYGIYLQMHYTYHARWFRLGMWLMALFVSGSAAGMLLAAGSVMLGAFSLEYLLSSYISLWSQESWDSQLILLLLLYALLWAALTIGLGFLTVSLAKRLAQEPAAGEAPPSVSWRDLPQLRLSPAHFRWSKAAPALAPLILMGYWCMFWRDDLPGWLYVSQKELYVLIWVTISLLTLLPLGKKDRRGMLLPAAALTLADLSFLGLLAYPRSYSEFHGIVVDNLWGELDHSGFYSFGQANEELIGFAAVLALLYLLCCFVGLRPKSGEVEKQGQEPRDQEETF